MDYPEEFNQNEIPETSKSEVLLSLFPYSLFPHRREQKRLRRVSPGSRTMARRRQQKRKRNRERASGCLQRRLPF